MLCDESNCYKFSCCAFMNYRLFGDKFSHFGIDLEAVLTVISTHPQYSCVAQIREQLASDGPVSFFLLKVQLFTYRIMCYVGLLKKKLCPLYYTNKYKNNYIKMKRKYGWSTKKHTNKGSKDGIKGQWLSLLLLSSVFGCQV